MMSLGPRLFIGWTSLKSSQTFGPHTLQAHVPLCAGPLLGLGCSAAQLPSNKAK